MIHGGKKWSTLTAAVLLALGSFALPQKVWAITGETATWDQIAKTGQTVSFLTETTGEGAEVTETKHNQLVANDGTVLATFKEGTITSGDTGFVSGGTVYDYLTDALSTAYTGSDTISVTDGVIKVANMAQSNTNTEGVRNGSTLAWGINAIAFGANASAYGEGALAIGSEVLVDGKNSFAIGASNSVYVEQSAAIGYNNSVNGCFRSEEGTNMYAFGSQNWVYGNQLTAIGYNNIVGEDDPRAEGFIKNSYVMGSNNRVLASDAFVFGSNVTVDSDAQNSVVLGNGSTVEKENTVSVGSDTLQRKIVHVAKGEANTDAATYGQIALKNQTVRLSTAARSGADSTLGKNNEIVANDGTVLATFEVGEVTEGNTGFVSGGAVAEALKNVGSVQSLTGSDSVTISDNKIRVANMAQGTSDEEDVVNGTTTARGTNAIAFGAIAEASGEGALAIGSEGLAGGNDSSAVGTGNKVYSDQSAAIGYNNTVVACIDDLAVYGENSYAFGSENRVYANQSTAIGYNNKVGVDIDDVDFVGAENSYVIGSNNTVLASNALAFGSGISITKAATGSVALGRGSKADAANTVSVGSDTLQRKIVHVASGSANTDAANFGQLMKATTYNATSSDASKVQTATLTSNDGSSSVSISIAGEGSVASGDNRLVSGDTVYKYIQDAIAGGSSGSAAEVEKIQENITTEGGTYIEAGKDVGGNLEKLDNAIGEVKLPEGQTEFNVIEESRNADGSLKTSMAENLMKIDAKIGSLDESRDPESNARAMKYNVISSGNTISENLEALDDAAFGATANLEEIAKKIQYEGATVTGESAIGLGQGSNASGSDSISLGTGAEASGASALALGKGANASKENAIAFGVGAKASGAGAVAIGSNQVQGDSSVSIGTGNYTDSNYTVTLGAINGASGDYAGSIGYLNRASEEKTYAFGYNNAVFGKESSAVGVDNALYGEQSAAMGYNNLVGQVSYDESGEVRTVSGNRSYAVGANNKVLADDAFVFGSDVTTVANNSVVLGKGSSSEEENTVSVGSAGSERRIVHVAAGVNDTDAVNVGQMNSAIGENFNYLKSSLTRDINKVAAGSAALAALRPEGFDPDDKFSMAVGFGHYKSANAGAIGAFYKPNYDTTFSIGATVGDGETIMNMGVSFKLGSRGKRVPLTGAALSQEVASLRENNEALKKDNASQAKEIADLKADNERMKEQIAMILAKMELSDTVEKSVVK